MGYQLTVRRFLVRWDVLGSDGPVAPVARCLELGLAGLSNTIVKSTELPQKIWGFITNLGNNNSGKFLKPEASMMDDGEWCSFALCSSLLLLVEGAATDLALESAVRTQINSPHKHCFTSASNSTDFVHRQQAYKQQKQGCYYCF